MNKKSVLIIGILLALLIGGAISFLSPSMESKVKDFDVATYNSYIKQFPSEEILGPIDDAKNAEEKAETVWLELYGDEVKNKKPYTIFFDDSNEVWLVEGSLSKNRIGGVPHILIQRSDGKTAIVLNRFGEL